MRSNETRFDQWHVQGNCRLRPKPSTAAAICITLLRWMVYLRIGWLYRVCCDGLLPTCYGVGGAHVFSESRKAILAAGHTFCAASQLGTAR